MNGKTTGEILDEEWERIKNACAELKKEKEEHYDELGRIGRLADLCAEKGIASISLDGYSITMAPHVYAQTAAETVASDDEPERDHEWDGSGMRPVNLRAMREESREDDA